VASDEISLSEDLMQSTMELGAINRIIQRDEWNLDWRRTHVVGIGI
jgi:hypothetical protein